MRIAILTQPLHANYGGLLQNYALQRVLKSMGHEPMTLDRHFYRPESRLKNIAKSIIRCVKAQYGPGYLTKAQRNHLAHHLTEFKTKHINTTIPLTTARAFRHAVAEGGFDAFIVGSDQCWRPMYSPDIAAYYLDFVNDDNIRRISYAASLGVNKWEYTDGQTALVAPLAKKFNAISVREESAVSLCHDHLGVEAHWVLDPTMLLGAEGFRSFISDNAPTGVTSYLLEDSPEAHALVRKTASMAGENIITDNMTSPIFKRFDSLESHVNIPVEKWVSNIANARVMVTDSFHGAVFAILFNIPFIVKLNGIRGNTRLHSLLKDFSLEHCLCSDIDSFTIPVINWEAVNAHLSDRQKESMTFLKQALQ